MKSIRVALPLLGMLVIVDASCSDATAPGDASDGRISITNDPSVLAGRVTYFDDAVPVDPPAGTSSMSGSPSANSRVLSANSGVQAQAFSLRLVAEVAPPSVNGQVLQATSVVIDGNRAVVSYNMRGAQYLGAIDYFELSNGVVLQSTARFQNTDISAATIAAGTSNVYAAEATSDAAFQYPAVFEKMQIQSSKLVLSGNGRMGLTSFAGTSVAVSGSKVYTTTGNDGGLSVIDPANLSLITSVNLHDARWVDVAGGKVVVAQGTPGQMSVFNETNMALVGTFPFKGANVAESKSTVQVVGGKAFIAAGDSGVQVLSVSTGKVVGSVPRPDPASLGLNPSVVVTNAASVDRDLLFSSNGEAGVYVAQGSQDFSATGSETQQQITPLGRLRFNNLQSVNHVVYSGGYLIIAAGLGGLKMVQVTR